LSRGYISGHPLTRALGEGKDRGEQGGKRERNGLGGWREGTIGKGEGQEGMGQFILSQNPGSASERF